MMKKGSSSMKYVSVFVAGVVVGIVIGVMLGAFGQYAKTAMPMFGFPSGAPLPSMVALAPSLVPSPSTSIVPLSSGPMYWLAANAVKDDPSPTNQWLDLPDNLSEGYIQGVPDISGNIQTTAYLQKFFLGWPAAVEAKSNRMFFFQWHHLNASDPNLQCPCDGSHSPICSVTMSKDLGCLAEFVSSVPSPV